MPAKKQSQKNESLNFEEAIERLENIIEKMEGERIPLEELLKDYEEGTRLLNACKEKINTAKEKVEKINNSLNEDKPSLDQLDEIID
ncbi:MAG: exodeoxyribonuclease VII small subunit [Verrucomicrobiales bacterium]|tara:strand:+ start:84 stop:344 length:261 start_codon:yes stop_codon:yes gene_type:complete